MANIGYLENCTDPGRMAARIQAQAQLDARKDACGWALRHCPSNSDSRFRPGPNYAGPSGRYSLPGRKLSLFLTVLFFAASGAVQAATIHAASPSRNAVAAAIAAASNGDTVIIPRGTASWASNINVTKGITIQGQTTTDSAAGTANDQTILIDNINRGSSVGYFHCTTSAGKSLRITGITFSGQGGLQTIASGGAVRLMGHSDHVRVDHCHFTHLDHNIMIAVYGAVFGVSDHNVFDDFVDQCFSHYITFPNYGGAANGDGSWAAPTGFGGPTFFFIEDNYIYLSYFGGSGGGGVDAFFGGKYVFRHNHMFNATTLGHSTGSSYPRGRGVRAQEVYNNDWHFSTPAVHLNGTTGGPLLFYNNTFDGKLVLGAGLAVYRGFYSYGAPFYGGSGHSDWDYNVTEADGTHVDGHTPYLFQSGTVTSGTDNTLTDTSKNWTINQWVGYTVKRLSDKKIGYVIASSSNTLTCYLYFAVNWRAGDQYQIHKALRILDQPGRGAGDLISGDPPTPAAWPHQVLDPCYSWNNIFTPTGAHINFVLGSPSNTIQQGRDYFNDTPKPGYTPYAYPHPLVRQ